jgi:hypothetical protein
MIIDRNSWHYKLYSLTYLWVGGVPTRLMQKTNLCQYMRRIMLGVPWWGFLMGAIIILATLFGPIFGYVPRTINPMKFFENDMRKYQGLRLGRSYNTFQVYPWHVILAVLFIGSEALIYHYCGARPMIVQASIVGGILALIGIVFGTMMYLDSSTGKIIKEYISAKKQKVCPIVEFQNEE